MTSRVAALLFLLPSPPAQVDPEVTESKSGLLLGTKEENTGAGSSTGEVRTACVVTILFEAAWFGGGVQSLALLLSYSRQTFETGTRNVF